MKGQKSQVLNGKEAFELINVFPFLLLSLTSLLFWKSGPLWLSLFSLPAFFLFLSWILPWLTSPVPCCPSPCWCVVTVHLTVLISQWVSAQCGCILDPTPSSLCYFRVFKALFFANSPAVSVFMNLNNLTFPAKKKWDSTAVSDRSGYHGNLFTYFLSHTVVGFIICISGINVTNESLTDHRLHPLKHYTPNYCRHVWDSSQLWWKQIKIGIFILHLC